MFVCLCQGVTDKQIREAARAGAHTVDDLGDMLGVARCCGRCAPEAHALLEPARAAPWAQGHRNGDDAEASPEARRGKVTG